MDLFVNSGCMVTVHRSYFWPAVPTIPNTNNLRGCGFRDFHPWGRECTSEEARGRGSSERKQREQGGAKGWATPIKGSFQGICVRQAGFASHTLPQPTSTDTVLFSAHFLFFTSGAKHGPVGDISGGFLNPVTVKWCHYGFLRITRLSP